MENIEKLNALFATKEKPNIELAFNILFSQLGIEVVTTPETITFFCDELFCFETTTLSISSEMLIYKDLQSHTSDYYWMELHISIPLSKLNEDMLWHIYNGNYFNENCTLPIRVFYNKKDTKHGDDLWKTIEFDNIPCTTR